MPTGYKTTGRWGHRPLENLRRANHEISAAVSGHAPLRQYEWETVGGNVSVPR